MFDQSVAGWVIEAQTEVGSNCRSGAGKLRSKEQKVVELDMFDKKINKCLNSISASDTVPSVRAADNLL